MNTRASLSLLVLAGALLAQGGPAHVEVAPVVAKRVAESRSFVGTVVPSRQSIVGSEVEGAVLEYLVEEGQRVDTGQPLCRLRDTLVGHSLAAARAQLLFREQALLELENGARPEEVAQARARLAQARADLELRRWKREAARRLHENGSVTEDELQEASLAATREEERVRETEEALGLIEAGPRAERIAQARAQVAEQNAQVGRLEEDLQRHTVRAPFAGHVVAEYVEVGQWLTKGARVVEIAALDEVDILVPVLEDYISGLKEGMTAVVTVGALPNARLSGRIRLLIPSADVRSRTFPVKVRVKNPAIEGVAPFNLKAGMFARVHLAVGEEREALLVPKDALVLGGPAPIVYVVDEQSATVRPVVVRPGIADDGLMVVEGELAAGALVVVRGNERLRPGQAVVVGGK